MLTETGRKGIVMAASIEHPMSPREEAIAHAAVGLLLRPNMRRSILVEDLGGSLGLSAAETETWLQGVEQRAAPGVSPALMRLARECRDYTADGLASAAELAVCQATGCMKQHARAWVRELANTLVPPPPLSAVCLEDLRSMPVMDRLQAVGIGQQDLLDLLQGAARHRAGDEGHAIATWAESRDWAAGLAEQPAEEQAAGPRFGG